MNDIILQDFTPSHIRQAINDYKIAYGTLLSTLPQAVLHTDPGICWFETGIALGLFNGALHTESASIAVSVSANIVR